MPFQCLRLNRTLILLLSAVKVGGMRVAQHKPAHPEKAPEAPKPDGDEADGEEAEGDTAEVAKKTSEKLTVSGAVTKV